MSRKNTILGPEPLDPLLMLSAITAFSVLEQSQQNITAAIHQALLGSGEQWSTQELQAITTAARGSPAFAALERTVNAWESESSEVSTLGVRAALLSRDVDDLLLRVTNERKVADQDRMTVDTIKSRLQQLSDVRDALHATCDTLSRQMSALNVEQTALQQRLPRELKQEASFRSDVASATKKRLELEAGLKPLQMQLSTLQKELQAIDALTRGRQQNKQTVALRNACQQSLNDLERRITVQEATIRSVKERETTLSASLTEEQQKISSIRARLLSIPQELSQASAAQVTASASLSAAQEQIEASTAEQAIAQSAYDQVFAQFSADDNSLSLDRGTETDIDSMITTKEQDVAAMRDAINQAIVALAEDANDHTETVDLAAATADGDGVLTANLARYGGSLSIKNWQGSSASNGTLTPASSQDLHRIALSKTIDPNEVTITPLLSTLMGLKEGFQTTNRYDIPLSISKSVSQLGPVGISGEAGYYPINCGPGTPSKPVFVKGGLVGASTCANYASTTPLESGNVTFGFGTPQYVRWIDIERITGSGNATVCITDDKGNVRTVATNDGIIAVDEIMQSFVIRNSSPTSMFGIRSINTTPPASDLNIPSGEWMQANGSLLSIDLSHTAKRTVKADVCVRSDQPGDVITATAYRGEKPVASTIVGADGNVHFEDESGMTSIIFSKSSKVSSLLFSGLIVTQAKDGAQPDPFDLTPEHNGTVAKFAAPTWDSGAPGCFQDVGKRCGVRYPDPGDNVGPGLLSFRNADDTDHYVRHEIRTCDGTATIADLLYVNDYGVYSVPHQYWKSIAPNAIITFPGCPKNLAFRVIGSGVLQYAGNLSPADTCDEAMPNPGIEVQSEVLIMRDPNNAEGWQSPPAAVSSVQFRTDCGLVNVLYRITNTGAYSGPVTARMHVGKTGTTADPVQKEITGALYGMSAKALSVTVSISGRGDIVTLEILDANGNSSTLQRRIINTYSMDDMTPEELRTAEATRAWETLQRNIEHAVATSPQLAAWRETVAASTTPPVATTPPPTESPILTGKTTVVADAGMPDGPLEYVPSGVRTDTAMGQAFVDLCNAFLPYANFVYNQRQLGLQSGISYDTQRIERYISAAKHMETLTGISFLKILHAASVSQSCSSVASARDAMVSGLRDLFITGQYGDIFDISKEGQMGMAGVATDKPEYSENDDHIRVRFDFATTSGTYASGNVYLLDCNGTQMGGALLSTNFSGINFIDIPMSAIRATLGFDTSYAALSLKVGLFEHAEDKMGLQGMNRSPSLIIRLTPHPIQDLSCLANTPENASRRATENLILSNIAFPVTPGDWSYGMGSGYHYGSGLFALDLNSSDDEGKPVTVATNGILEKVDLAQGEVVIRHTLPDGTVWRSTYYHMTHILENLTGVHYMGTKEAAAKGANTEAEAAKRAAAQQAIDSFIANGQVLTQGMNLGTVGSEGDSTGPHLHFQENFADGSPIDLFRWTNALQPGFAVSGNVDGKTMTMHWDDTAMALVNNEDGILMQRVNVVDTGGNATGSENIAYAWTTDPTQRQRLVWIHELNDGTVVDAWLNMDHTKKWNSSSRTWENY